MSDLVKDLQKKPYAERVKIFRTALIVVAVLIVIIWGVTIRFRSHPQGEPSKFKEIWENAKNIKFNGQAR